MNIVNQTGGSTPANVFIDVAPGDLPAGTYSGEVRLSVEGSAQGVVIAVKLEIRPAAGAMALRDVVNAGSRLPGPVAPGSLIEIRGSNIAKTTEQATAVPLPLSLAGLSVQLGEVSIPLHTVAPDRVVAQLPFNLQSGPHSLRVRSSSLDTSDVAFSVTNAAPGIILQGERAAALNEDGTVNSRQDPAKPDSTVSVFLTGQGQVVPSVSVGVGGPAAPLSRPVLAVTASVGGAPAVVGEAVLAPGQAGVLQVNLAVPDLPPGEYLLQVKVGDSVSNTAILSVGSR